MHTALFGLRTFVLGSHTNLLFALVQHVYLSGVLDSGKYTDKSLWERKEEHGVHYEGCVCLSMCVFSVCQWESNSACLCDGRWVGERWSTIVFSSKMGESFTLGAFLKAVWDFCFIVVFGIFYANAKHKLNSGGESKGTKCDWWAFQQTLAALFLAVRVKHIIFSAICPRMATFFFFCIKQ